MNTPDSSKNTQNRPSFSCRLHYVRAFTGWPMLNIAGSSFENLTRSGSGTGISVLILQLSLSLSQFHLIFMSFVAILSVKCRFFKAMSLVEFYPNRASISLQWRTQEGGPALPPASVLDQTETRRAGNNFYETRPSHPLYQGLDVFSESWLPNLHNFCWVYADDLSEPLPHYYTIYSEDPIEAILSTFWQM